ncbi:MAG: hypothetical protein D6698_01580 [Gammaproteobacteria bacterium]|nr:MAG: hypothetical protein D6698_01580 [Gammaproteobacteria bacterium]
MTILRVSSRGKTSLFTDICLFARNNPNLIYQWAWTPFFLGDRVHLVCPVPPVMDQGCVPLSHVPERYTDPKRRCIFTPAGFHRYIEEPLICDLKEDIVLPLDNDVYELEFAGVRFGAFEVLQGHVLWIEPSIEALSCKLWTCHLARLVYLHPILHPALVE